MYQALYRKYRPIRFSDVTGQGHITETLKRQITSGRLSHAYLFVGTRGTGKTTCAKILSRAVNCLSPIDGDPCNNCKACIGIENGSVLDVLELDAASNNGVDNVRALREEAIYTPASVSKRVYIIDEVHMLSTAAFNALLKILEEPPEHLLFILATTELHKVPPTIMSRCQRFSFKRPSPEAIATRLNLVAEMEGISLAADAAQLLASLADGSFRDGLSLLDQCAGETNIDCQRVLDTVGLAGRVELLRLVGAIASRNTPDALSVLDGLYTSGRDMASLLSEIAGLMRDLLVYRLSADSPLLSSNYGKSEISALSAKLSSERLFSMLNTIRESTTGLSRGGSSRLAAELCLIRLCDERLNDDNAALLARIARLEAGAAPEIITHSSEPRVNDYQESDSESNLSEIIVHESEEVIVPETESIKPFEKTPEVEQVAPAGDFLADDQNDFWQNILGELESEISVYALLSDSTEVNAQLQDNILVVRARSPFIVAQLESPSTSAIIGAAANKTLGRDVILSITQMEDAVADSKHDKLEKLVDKFDIVNFES